MIKEVLSELIEIRPGRKLFCRHSIIGSQQQDQPGYQEDNATVVVDQRRQRRRHLVFIHGTVASQDQYLPLLKALDDDISHDEVGIIIHCWLYDAVGCGKSPAIHNKVGGSSSSSSSQQKDYSDEEQVQDLHAFMMKLVLPEMMKTKGLPSTTTTTRTIHEPELFMIGHSYGPTWIFKWMSFLKMENTTTSTKEEQQQQESESTTLSADRSLLLLQPKSVILLCTGVQSKDLIRRGPLIFRYDYIPPLWFLNCIQPYLTKMFLRLGYSKVTRTNQPELIQQAQTMNGKNDMQIVRYYYRSHDWLSDVSSFANNTPSTTTTATKFLVLHGTEDEIVPIRNGQVVANQLKTALISIDDSSHMVHQEQPKVVAQHIIQFMHACMNE